MVCITDVTVEGVERDVDAMTDILFRVAKARKLFISDNTNITINPYDKEVCAKRA